MKETVPRSEHRPGEEALHLFAKVSTALERDAGQVWDTLVQHVASRGHSTRRRVASTLTSVLTTPVNACGCAPFAKLQLPGPARNGHTGAGGAGQIEQDQAQTVSSSLISPYPSRNRNKFEESAAFEPFAVEDIVASFADSTRSAVGHAQTSLETAQHNWSSLLAGTSKWADDAGFALRGATNGTKLESAFGDLWNDAMPSFNKGRGCEHPLEMQAWKQLRRDRLRDPGRHVTIVTTASLPWMTGTAVNPLLRAHYLADQGVQRMVTLVVPWLSKSDQEIVYPNSMTFDNPEAQEKYIREWVEKRTGTSSRKFKVSFYPGRYAPEKGSILPVGDLTKWIPEHEADVAILEEPEHLNWYQHGRRWTDKFNHVVGIMHTNYLDYARREENGAVKSAILRAVNSLVCRVHCHKVIKLSDAVQRLPRQCVEFVHGVSPRFLEVGAQKAQAAKLIRDVAASTSEAQPWGKGAYFLGKVVWAKGYTELLDLLEQHKARCGQDIAMHVYGSGDDASAVRRRAQTSNLALTFHPGRDHADEELQDFKVFVNPSLSDVVATTTAEALAMGKFVVCADHPCNRFFSTFSNCIIYRSPQEFSEKLEWALTHEPQPLSHSELARLSWEDATERFLDAVQLSPLERPNFLERALDNVVAAGHNALTGVEPLRIAAGAGAATLETPQRVTDYQPCHVDVGGFFDNHKRAADVRNRV